MRDLTQVIPLIFPVVFGDLVSTGVKDTKEGPLVHVSAETYGNRYPEKILTQSEKVRPHVTPLTSSAVES